MKKFLILLFAFLNISLGAYASGETELPSEIGKVIGVSYADVQDLQQGAGSTKQIAEVIVESGMFKGTTRYIDNMLTGNPAYDINLKKGDKVILHAETINSDDDISVEDVDFFIADLKRDSALLLIAAVFAGLLIVVGRKKGIYSLISILATIVFMFVGLVPMILSGVSPIIASVVVGILSTIITIYLVSGRNAKSLSAIIGTTLSLLLAGVLSVAVISAAKLTGFAGEESVFLYTANSSLDFKGLLAASIIIAALGALMDTAVSIASTINEIHETDNNLSVGQLFRSGMNVGRDVIGTMSNTLILVYLGSSLPLVLLSNNIDFQKFFNLNQVATEISSALVGSIAILACVPITAIIAAILVKNQKEKVEFNFDEE